MGRLTLNAIDGSADIYGSELAFFRVKINELHLAFLSLPNFPHGYSTYTYHLGMAFSEDHYIRAKMNFDHSNGVAKVKEYIHPVEFISDVKIALSSAAYDEKLFGHIDNARAGLNTALVIGNDALRLASRISGQCELHLYVKPENFEWLSSIINYGLLIGLYRPNAGWESAIDLLKQTRSEPIVMSYSVSDSYPNPHISNWDEIKHKFEVDQDETNGYYDLSHETRWHLATEQLLKIKWLELKPSNFSAYRYLGGWDALKIEQLLGMDSLDTIRKTIDIFSSYTERYYPDESWLHAKAEAELYADS